ncbi:MAG: 50S ribosomal protein L10 [Flavobacteriales bacterium]
MTRAEKDQMIEELTQVLVEQPVVYLTDASGMDSESTTAFRRECYKNNIGIRMVKNTLLRKAMERVEGKDYSELYDVLKGQTVMLLGEVGNAPAKVLKDFNKKEEQVALKAAYVEEACYVGANHLEALTAIKSKDELIAEVVALLQSPAKNVLGSLQSGGNTLSGLVKALSEREG